jgi:ribosomal-protein-alanine N-acetyltransferase
MPNPPRIESDRLILDSFRPEDAEALFAYASNPSVAKWMAWEPHRDIAESRRVLQQFISAMPGQYEWAIRLREPAELVDGFTFLLRNDQTGEIHFTLAETHWGRGIATEAGRMVLARVWAAHAKLRLITTAPAAENTASLKVLERLGFAAATHRRSGWQKFPTGIEVIDYRLPRSPRIPMRLAP